MIQDLKISNFKCFKEVHLPDLSRFNVIVGRNGGGKTAFLEALSFLPASDRNSCARYKVCEISETTPFPQSAALSRYWAGPVL